MSDGKVLKIRVSLKGRPLHAFRFVKDVIEVGRDPDADIFLDNPSISRHHLKIERTPGGYYAAEDLGSSNGTYVNDKQIRREYLMKNDVVRVGKYALWVTYEEDARSVPTEAGKPVSPKTYEGTTVLSVSELEEMMEHAAPARRPELKLVEAGTGPPTAAPHAGLGEPEPASHRIPVGWLVVAAFSAGLLGGAIVLWFVMQSR